jgi:hypothetical protein
MHHPTDFLKYLINQVTQKLNARDLEVVEEIDQPIPADQLGQFAGRSRSDVMTTTTGVNETGFLQVKFDLDGVPMAGSLGTTVRGSFSAKHMPNRPDQVVVESGTFGVGPTTVLISPAQADPKKAKEMQLIASSMTMTPRFLNYWRALTAKLAGVVIGANAAGQKYADSTFHDRVMAQFRGDMAMKDAYTHQFCNYIQDQQDYKDSRGQVVSLPASYKHVWDDGQGNYLLTDDPTTDPRGYGSGKWEPLEKAKPGD